MMDGCETGILIDFSEPTEISLDGMETFKTLNSANKKNQSGFDEDQKENVYVIEDSKEFVRSGSEKQNSFTMKTPNKEKNGVLGDVTDFVTNLKNSVQDVQNSPTVTRLIDEETFDFDLPLTPPQDEISPEVSQLDNEEEVFFGPVGFTERCVRTVVGNIDPLAEEVKPLSPLRPDQWAELVKEANIVAFRLQEGQTSSSDDNLSPVQHVSTTRKRNLGFSEYKPNGNKNYKDSKQDKITDPGLMSPRNGHRRSDTFIVNTEKLQNDIKVLPVIKTPTESFNPDITTKRAEDVRVKQDKLSESKSSSRDASVGQEKRSSNERLSAAEQITNKPVPGSKLSRLPKNRSVTSLHKPRIEAIANNSEIKTSYLSLPKSNNAVSSKPGGMLITPDGTKENNGISTTGDRKKSASRGLVRSGSLREPSKSLTEVQKNEDRKSGSTGLTRKDSLKGPSKTSSFTRKSGGESQTNVNDTVSKVGPAAAATKTLRSSRVSQVTAQGTAHGNTTNESMFLKQNVQKTGIPAPKTKLHLYKPGTVQNALILNRGKQGDNIKCNGPMKALVPVSLSEKQTDLKPAGRSYSDSSVSSTPMMTEKHVQPKCLLSSSFITPNNKGRYARSKD
ncbi:hypothetical protein CHS0354_039366 [Potamilus streckersoni]|uniref:G2 and S phase-expressed protein 1 N-terminal domain-containing protein n=1 Tax=Potamilus streckersoni TaxID=2493646 RepID=A0AAE0T389_9BIVA|nr:hypothetical protein CHS0354_039366 [Potamilus streckersoni]